jgi:adenylate cyclase
MNLLFTFDWLGTQALMELLQEILGQEVQRTNVAHNFKGFCYEEKQRHQVVSREACVVQEAFSFK